MIDFRSLFKAGVQFGHQRKRLCPKMNRYIWGQKSGVSLIDVSQTAQRLEAAAAFLKSVVESGGTVLWVGTKKSAKKAIGEAAAQTDMPWVNHRWIGGTLSNFSQVKKSVTKLLHLEDSIEKTDEREIVTKKELSVMRKTIDRLRQNIGGIQSLVWPIQVVVIVDVNKERSAVREAARMGVPIVGIVDTNSDPSMVDYVIPSNDDAPQAVSLLVDYLKAATQDGIEVVKKRRAAEEEEKKKQAAAKVKESAEAIKASVAKQPAKKAPKKAEVKNVTKQATPGKREVAKSSGDTPPKAKKGDSKVAVANKGATDGE